MAHDLMTHCEQRRQYKVNGAYEWRWKQVAASEIADAPTREIRCMHCNGLVRVGPPKAPEGQQIHIEHRFRQDSEGCRAGHFFKGEHRMSSKPIE